MRTQLPFNYKSAREDLLKMARPLETRIAAPFNDPQEAVTRDLNGPMADPPFSTLIQRFRPALVYISATNDLMTGRISLPPFLHLIENTGLQTPGIPICIITDACGHVDGWALASMAGRNDEWEVTVMPIITAAGQKTSCGFTRKGCGINRDYRPHFDGVECQQSML